MFKDIVYKTLFDPEFDAKDEYHPNKIPKDIVSEVITNFKLATAISICVFCTVKISKKSVKPSRDVYPGDTIEVTTTAAVTNYMFHNAVIFNLHIFIICPNLNRFTFILRIFR